MEELQAKYAKLKAQQLEQGLCDWVATGGQLLQTWDDHDRGENDCGKYYEKAAESRDIFFDFWRGELFAVVLLCVLVMAADRFCELSHAMSCNDCLSICVSRR